MSLCQSNSEALVKQDVDKHRRSNKTKTAWRMRIRQSTGIAYTRTDRSDERIPHNVLLGYKSQQPQMRLLKEQPSNSTQKNME
jgi:hypothetical protein